jgi:hypothetical protein
MQHWGAGESSFVIPPKFSLQFSQWRGDFGYVGSRLFVSLFGLPHNVHMYTTLPSQ